MTPKIQRAFELMYTLEPNRYRKFSPLPQGYELYWTHLYSVYKTCIYWGHSDETILLAAVLHDAIEDTAYTYEEIKTNFGEECATIVQICSKKSDYKDFAPVDQDEYFNRIKNYPDSKIKLYAMTIKLADRLDNLAGSSFIDDKGTKEKYLQETIKYYSDFARELKKESELNNLLEYYKKYALV